MANTRRAPLDRRTGQLACDPVIEPTFEIAEYGRWVLMRVVGEIDMATAPKLRQSVQTVAARKPAGLVLDLDGVDFIDSTGLGVMVGAARRMRMIDGGFRIACSQPHLIELFHITRLDEVFDIYESLDAAKASVGGPSAPGSTGSSGSGSRGGTGGAGKSTGAVS